MISILIDDVRLAFVTNCCKFFFENIRKVDVCVSFHIMCNTINVVEDIII